MYYVMIYPMSEVPLKLKQQIEYDSQFYDIDTEEIYNEQQCYIKEMYKDSFFVAAYKIISDEMDPENDVYIGGVALFFDAETAIDIPSPAFQGISKSIKGYDYDVKLNSLVLPAIIDFIKDKSNYTKVHVRPFGKQKQILFKHYRFGYLDEDGVGIMVRNIDL